MTDMKSLLRLIGPQKIYICLLFLVAHAQNVAKGQLQDSISLKTDPLTIDLYHKFEANQDFKLRGSILVRPKTEYRPASASILNQIELTDSDLEAIRESLKLEEAYYLKASLRPNKKSPQDKPVRTTQTIVKTCSLASAKLVDYITVNLSPANDFVSVNLHTADHSCSEGELENLPRKFNTSILVESGSVAPIPDTATYIKRLEEERQNKLKEGKEDNRSFFAKYWIYIVPAVIILMVFSGPGEQGGR